MKTGIMQPYFIPYIGYWQLMNAVDQYVIYDDVNFIKGGWINRNRILIGGQPKYFNISMLGASPNKKINEIGVNHDPKLRDKDLRMLEGSYRKAPFYGKAMPLMEQILASDAENLADYIAESFGVINAYLGITTKLIKSSSLSKDCSLKGQDKVIAICKLLGTDEYYNAIGGQELYSFEEFRKNGMKLCFLRTDEIRYEQFGGEFQPNLSILDVMMFNSAEQVRQMLDRYTLISEEHLTRAEETEKDTRLTESDLSEVMHAKKNDGTEEDRLIGENISKNTLNTMNTVNAMNNNTWNNDSTHTIAHGLEISGGDKI